MSGNLINTDIISKKKRIGVIIALSILSIVLIMLLKPIPQDPSYHNFADQRILFNISHFGDVITSLLFILVGIIGSWFTCNSESEKIIIEYNYERIPIIVFFISVFSIGLGSIYYHLTPNNITLFWDRLPMTIAFMSLLCMIIGEMISARSGFILLWPLIAFGLFSVYWWAYTETLGYGDLRLYAYVQFYPIIAIVLMFIFFKSRYTRDSDYWIVLLWYFFAKIGEIFDKEIFDLNNILTGHNLKHLFAAASIVWILRMLIKRKIKEVENRI